MSDLSKTRQDAERQARTLLGIDDLGTDALFRLAETVFGQQRSSRCLELARMARLSRRADATSSVVELIVGTRDLGAQWWSRAHEDMTAPAKWDDRGTPDHLLARMLSRLIEAETLLRQLASWISDDAADALWGRPIDYVDLNDPDADDRIYLPENAVEGDRLIASFDPGHRVWARVVRRDDRGDPALEPSGRRRNGLGSVLAETEIVSVLNAGWAYAIATNVGPINLPGETPRGPSDPFMATIDSNQAKRLSTWALKHDHDTAEQCRWITKADLWSGYSRLGLPYSRTGEWWPFDRAASAIVDGEVADAEKWLSKLP